MAHSFSSTSQNNFKEIKTFFGFEDEEINRPEVYFSDRTWGNLSTGFGEHEINRQESKGKNSGLGRSQYSFSSINNPPFGYATVDAERSSYPSSNYQRAAHTTRMKNDDVSSGEEFLASGSRRRDDNFGSYNLS